jgi:hypothetical protein
MNLIYSSTKKQKLVQTVSACTESTYLLLKAFKKYTSRGTIPLNDFTFPVDIRGGKIFVFSHFQKVGPNFIEIVAIVQTLPVMKRLLLIRIFLRARQTLKYEFCST